MKGHSSKGGRSVDKDKSSELRLDEDLAVEDGRAEEISGGHSNPAHSNPAHSNPAHTLPKFVREFREEVRER